MTTQVFVYGTLMPGQGRWRALAGYADPDRPPIQAQTWGLLYDTGWGWPAAVLGRGMGGRLIPGFVVALDPRRGHQSLAELDEIEGVAHELFHRIRVSAGASICWAYHWPGHTDGFVAIESWA